MRSFTTFRMTRKGKLKKILKHFSFSAETVPKLHIVILQPAKNLLFFFSGQKIKRRDHSDFVLMVAGNDPMVSFCSRRRISFFLFKLKKSQNENLRTKILRMTRKGKLKKFLNSFHFLLDR